MLSDSRVKCHS